MGDQPGGAGNMPAGGGTQSSRQNPTGPRPSENEGDPGLAPEQADLANKKRATELALKRLRDQLERGDAPADLKERLGFTDQDLEGFMNRLEERLADPGADRSAESDAARRQFESLLKGIDAQSKGDVRKGEDHERNAASGFAGPNRPVPPEYRLEDQGYKRKSSREGTVRE